MKTYFFNFSYDHPCPFIRAHSHCAAFFSDCDCDSSYHNKWVAQDSVEVFTLCDCDNIINSYAAHCEQKQITVANHTVWTDPKCYVSLCRRFLETNLWRTTCSSQIGPTIQHFLHPINLNTKSSSKTRNSDLHTHRYKLNNNGYAPWEICYF